MRGNAAQVYEKYQNLARDATSAGDRVAAESYHQFAEHYFRILNDSTDPQRAAPDQQRPAQDSQHSGQERPRPGREPYPVDAEQPFVEGAGSAGRGNGQSPEPEAKPDGAGAEPSDPQVSNADIPATQAAQPVETETPAIEPEPPQAEPAEAEPVEAELAEAEPAEAEPKPRRRGRPRKSGAANSATKDSKPAAEEPEVSPEAESADA